MNIFSVFKKALDKKYVLGAFNFYNLESLQAILDAGETCKVPVICAASESALKYMGVDVAVAMFKALTVNKRYPAFLHLDHGKSYKICKKAIDAGFDSVMIDGSSLSFNQNIALTKKVVCYAKKREVFVEGELGALSGVEDDLSSDDSVFTDPDEAKVFIEKTGVNSLAIAIGTSHGAYKGKPKLRMDIVSEIENRVGKFPLVLHGASTVDAKLINKINSFGGEIDKAAGILVSDLKEICKKHNICKINFDTDLRLAFIGETREILYKNLNETNPRTLLGNAKRGMFEVVKDRIENILKVSSY